VPLPSPALNQKLRRGGRIGTSSDALIGEGK
jgi:hypothetical protein